MRVKAATFLMGLPLWSFWKVVKRNNLCKISLGELTRFVCFLDCPGVAGGGQLHIAWDLPPAGRDPVRAAGHPRGIRQEEVLRRRDFIRTHEEYYEGRRDNHNAILYLESVRDLFTAKVYRASTA